MWPTWRPWEESIPDVYPLGALVRCTHPVDFGAIGRVVPRPLHTLQVRGSTRIHWFTGIDAGKTTYWPVGTVPAYLRLVTDPEEIAVICLMT